MDDYGQLGNGGDYVDSINNQSSRVWSPPSIPVDVGTGRSPVSVNTALRHTCAILDNGDLKCWGSDSYGRLGDGGSVDPTTYDANVVLGSPSATPIDLGQGRTAVAVQMETPIPAQFSTMVRSSVGGLTIMANLE